jgi:hypothetical protein
MKWFFAGSLINWLEHMMFFEHPLIWILWQKLYKVRFGGYE